MMHLPKGGNYVQRAILTPMTDKRQRMTEKKIWNHLDDARYFHTMQSQRPGNSTRQSAGSGERPAAMSTHTGQNDFSQVARLPRNGLWMRTDSGDN
ncbi:hypothetical protein EVAR_51187_1 [Eumeta japonica]|uniref:Uncharacterized protein n=1 Tax=Eumeta variegata TaxID=151549 RepID=A0A4C1XF25_EUMVA|nr:hypothetical protein EVAR_51187_1 [Eumeta japonica]